MNITILIYCKHYLINPLTPSMLASWYDCLYNSQDSLLILTYTDYFCFALSSFSHHKGHSGANDSQ